MLLQAAPPRTAAAWVVGSSRARWTAPDGQARSGQIPVSAGLAAGHTVGLWVDAAGWPTGPPPGHGAAVAREAAAPAVATAALVAA